MDDHCDTHGAAEPLRIARELEDGLRCGRKQQVEKLDWESRTSGRSSAGSVKTTWKCLTGKARSTLAATQRAWRSAWHFGQ
jgi:hypothetical protein